MIRRNIKSQPGLFGTVYYYDEHGNPIGKSHPGLLEGTRVYTDQNGRYTGKSRPGFLAQEVFTDADHNHITSYEGICGEVHFENGVPIGYSRSGFFDSEYSVLETEDDLSEEECCEEDSFDEECSSKACQDTVVKNLLLLVLCIVISIMIACIYAIIRVS